jgi:hypothetical protein
MPKRKPIEQPQGEFLAPYWNKIVEARKAEGPPWKVLSDPSEIAKKSRLISYTPPFCTDLWPAVADWWPIELLRTAKERGDSEGFKRLLYYFLLLLSAEPPKGVLEPFHWRRGRPIEKERDKVYLLWISLKCPTLTKQVLDGMAKSLYPDEWKSEPSNISRHAKLRKKLRDRIRQTVRRAESATKITSISS